MQTTYAHLSLSIDVILKIEKGPKRNSRIKSCNIMTFCPLSILKLYVSLRYDYLEIINDEDTSFGKYCGGMNKKEINVTGMLAQLQFHSDSDIQKGGFMLFFSLVPLSG